MGHKFDCQYKIILNRKKKKKKKKLNNYYEDYPKKDPSKRDNSCSNVSFDSVHSKTLYILVPVRTCLSTKYIVEKATVWTCTCI